MIKKVSIFDSRWDFGTLQNNVYPLSGVARFAGEWVVFERNYASKTATYWTAPFYITAFRKAKNWFRNERDLPISNLST